MKTIANESSNNSQESINQIRDIIFGEQIDEFMRHIKMLEHENNELKKKIVILENKYKQTKQSLEQNIKKQNLFESDQKDAYDLINQIKKDLEKRMDAFEKTKVDKNQIGQVFIEWGMKVKQTENNKNSK